MPHAIAAATHTARGISDHEHKSSCGAAVRRRHQRGSSWQLTTATTSTTSARQCTPSSMAARSSDGAATFNTVAAWMDGRLRRPNVGAALGAALGRPPKSNPTDSDDETGLTARAVASATSMGERARPTSKHGYLFWSLRFTCAVDHPTLYRGGSETLSGTPKSAPA